MHPEATGDLASLRWVTATSGLPHGPVTATPGPLGERLARGELSIEVTPAAVVITLSEPLTWRRDGTAIRTELTAALAERGAWRAAGGSAPADIDAALSRLAQEAIAGAPGDYVRSHGGSVELVGVCNGHVTLRLTGACAGCPASGATLHRGFEDELRRRCPELVSVGLAHT